MTQSSKRPKRGRILKIAAAALILLFYLWSNEETAVFLLTAALVAASLAALAAFGGGRGMTCTLEVPGQMEKGQEATFRLRLKNPGRIPVFRGSATIEVCNMITGEQTRQTLSFSLGGKAVKEYSFTLRDIYCGCLEVTAGDFCMGDPFSLFCLKRKLGLKETICCFPRPAILPLTRDELEQYDMESFRYSQQKKGDDPSDTFGVKLYVPGDNVKAIHWKLSGKTDELMVKEFGLPVDSQILILADRDLTAEMTPRQRSELTETAIHLSYTLLGENLPHCVGWYDYGTADFVIQTVTTEDNFWEAARGLLAAPFQADQLSSVAHFIAAEQGKPYSTYLWVSYGETDIERLMQYGRVNAYKPELFP